jgi:uncharacterized spore protein YtfJ
MHVQELLAQAREVMTVRRVFGEPIERNGLTIIPVANVFGGAGAGSDAEASPEAGVGGGMGVWATPAGVYVIHGQTVSWQPALNVNRVILGGQLVAIALLLTVRAIVQARAGGRTGRPALVRRPPRAWARRLPRVGG